MNLAEVLKAVKEEHLNLNQLEDYSFALTNLYADMQLALAEVRKKKALYFVEHPEKTVAGTGIKWSASTDGLREIDLSHQCRATEKVLSSLKSRIYRSL